MKMILSALILANLALATARAGDYPVLEDYRQLAEKLVQTAQATQPGEDRSALAQSTRELIHLGAEIMRLYASRNPVCATQFEVVLNELPAMETLSLEAVDNRYHDGVGLPNAPKHCYFGRSQVVHPVMNLIRMKEGWNERTRDEVVEEFHEVIEHLARIRKNLDQPPQ